ncbi:hypothetical protein GLAREA_10079 [Glarea lozoyensis ATCC 20868]|uniref:Mid2 domain-containing protein n=1 Tax=Glarea lozoyensis (strain ATCC 20868 / MF5171) TaxID=1116229 RepID=S3D9I1_GLAL2|nr:uncharacterized protein GLAREA_10079 [Glarea lozoyensis ATCC 20868]EPE34385.1 hypothetical protein GLAREA_10079 [Glarea lozoyensis ATCC 20868]
MFFLMLALFIAGVTAVPADLESVHDIEGRTLNERQCQPCGTYCCDYANNWVCNTYSTYCSYSYNIPSIPPPTPAYYSTPNYYTAPSPTPVSSTTCSTYETTCGSYCCNEATQSCKTDSSGSDYCGTKYSEPDGTSSKSSKKIPGKAIAGIVIGVLAALSLIGSGILYCCCGIGRKKAAEQSTPIEPPGYDDGSKNVEPGVAQVAPEKN